MTITLITGANKGLGYETARRLIDLGHTVLAGARDRQRGTEAARGLGATFIHLDPTDDGSVETAAARIRNEYGHLDVLINNAGTAAPRLGAEELTASAAMEGFAINVFGPIRVTHAFCFTSTDFNNHRGTQTVTEGTDAIVRLATLPPDGPTGTFQDRHAPVPW